MDANIAKQLVNSHITSTKGVGMYEWAISASIIPGTNNWAVQSNIGWWYVVEGQTMAVESTTAPAICKLGQPA